MSELIPGPELDALIAEEVMARSSSGKPHWTRVGHPDELRDVEAGYYITGATGAIYREPGGLWSPSQDIRAAWEVVERFRDIWFVLNSRQHDGDWYCQAGHYRNDVIGQTAPHAICLAALKAMARPTSGEPRWAR